MFEGLRTKIDAHFGASPLVKHRAEFLGVNASTPLDRKVKFTPEVVGAAAAFESWKAFERDPAHKPHGDSKLAHARAKQIVADLAASMAIRLIDEKRLPFTSTANEEKFKLDAQRFARGDAKRALRESGYYKTHELGPFEDDERAAPRKI